MIEDDYDFETESDEPDVPIGPWFGLVWGIIILFPMLIGLAALAEIQRWTARLMR